MSLDAIPYRPLWVRGLNALGAGLRRLGWELVSLAPEDLLREAERRTGLTDYGGDEFREPLRRFLTSLEAEAQLSTLGRILARQDALCVLQNRLQISALCARHPEILEAPVPGPVFITGLPRSGTSILHELLAQDPAHRCALYWEVRYAYPPPTGREGAGDARIRRAQRDFTLWPRIVPAYATMHEMDARLPTECGDITTHTFLGDRMAALHQVPSYATWAATRDARVLYEWHRKMLQVLQWQHSCDRWVLKAPAHMNWLPQLLSVYPDARVVQTHRDPLQVMGSVASLITAILWMRAERVDPEIVKAAFGGEFFATQLAGAMAFRDAGSWERDPFFDVRYQDLTSDAFGVLRELYAHLETELTDDAEQRMRSYLDHKPKGKFGAHVYAFEDLGLDLETERRRFAIYQERYAIASEVS